MTRKVTVMSVGDIILDLENHDSALNHVAPILQKGDITFGNCDQCYSDLGESPNGFWPIHVSAVPHAEAMLDSLKTAGFTLLNFGNNHALDWGYEAMFDCLDKADQRGLEAFGMGRNLQEARAPKIVEIEGTTFGFLAYCCVGPRGYEATEQRPGFAPMRAHTFYEQWDPQPGTPPLIHSFADRDDLAAMKDDVLHLREKVDIVLVSFHMGVHYIPELIADYQFEIGRAAIDCGADAVFGHHAHLPKGIEVYNGKVIFHGMHNFACRGEWTPPSMQPGSNFPESHHWDFTRFGKMFEERFGAFPPEIKRPTMIAQLTVEDRAITEVHFHPCYINDDQDPEPVGPDDKKGQFVIDYFQKISRSQGLDTLLEWDDDLVRIVTG